MKIITILFLAQALLMDENVTGPLGVPPPGGPTVP